MHKTVEFCLKNDKGSSVFFESYYGEGAGIERYEQALADHPGYKIYMREITVGDWEAIG